jgi:hypothetical protein
MMDDALRLSIELVPKSSFFNNLRTVVSTEEWDRIRKRTYADYEHRCGICGATGRLACHERWAYDDTTHEQRLLGFIALCDLCHHVKHIGYAGVLAMRGQLDLARVVEHFLRVNDCDRATFERHKREAFALWRERSRQSWRIHLGDYEGIIRRQ